MVEKKFAPSNAAKSNSPFLVANAMNFDVMTLLQQVEQSKIVKRQEKMRQAEEKRLAKEELERQKAEATSPTTRGNRSPTFKDKFGSPFKKVDSQPTPQGTKQSFLGKNNRKSSIDLEVVNQNSQTHNQRRSILQDSPAKVKPTKLLAQELINLEESETESVKEYNQKLEEYLGSLDDKKRQWEERKIEHYKKKGITYDIPGYNPKKDQKKSKPTGDPGQNLKKKEYKEGFTTTVFKMAQEATELEKDMLEDKINSMRAMMSKMKLQTRGQIQEMVQGQIGKYAVLEELDYRRIKRIRDRKFTAALDRQKRELRRQHKEYREKETAIFKNGGIPLKPVKKHVFLDDSIYEEKVSPQNQKYIDMIQDTSKKISQKLIDLHLIEKNSDLLVDQETLGNETASDGKQQVSDFDASSIDSQVTNWIRYPDLGKVELHGNQARGQYLPKVRERRDITVVPADRVMRKNMAPNRRLEPRLPNSQGGKKRSLKELLIRLGLARPEDLSKGFSKEPTVAPKTLYQYMLGVLRLDYMKANKIKFSDFSSEYWKVVGSDRIMAYYQQIKIQKMAEGTIHERLVPTTTKHQTKQMAKLFDVMAQELIDYASKRPNKYNLPRMVQQAEDHWKLVFEMKQLPYGFEKSQGYTSPKPELRSQIHTGSNSRTPSKTSRVDLIDLNAVATRQKSSSSSRNSLSSEEEQRPAQYKITGGSLRKMQIVDQTALEATKKETNKSNPTSRRALKRHDTIHKTPITLPERYGKKASEEQSNSDKSSREPSPQYKRQVNMKIGTRQHSQITLGDSEIVKADKSKALTQLLKKHPEYQSLLQDKKLNIEAVRLQELTEGIQDGIIDEAEALNLDVTGIFQYIEKMQTEKEQAIFQRKKTLKALGKQ